MRNVGLRTIGESSRVVELHQFALKCVACIANRRVFRAKGINANPLVFRWSDAKAESISTALGVVQVRYASNDLSRLLLNVGDFTNG
jgi:hypothetical protein